MAGGEGRPFRVDPRSCLSGETLDRIGLSAYTAFDSPSMIPTLLCLALLQTPPANTDNPDPAGLGPKVGEVLPVFSLEDQHGKARDLVSLTGPKGLVLVFFRSADW